MGYKISTFLIVSAAALFHLAAIKKPTPDPCEKAARRIKVYDRYEYYKTNRPHQRQGFFFKFSEERIFEEQNKRVVEIANDLILDQGEGSSELHPKRKKSENFPLPFLEFTRRAMEYRYRVFFYNYVEAFNINNDGTRVLDQERPLTLGQLFRGSMISRERIPLIPLMPEPNKPEGYNAKRDKYQFQNTKEYKDYSYYNVPEVNWVYFNKMRKREVKDCEKVDGPDKKKECEEENERSKKYIYYEATLNELLGIFKIVLRKHFTQVKASEVVDNTPIGGNYPSDHYEFIVYNDKVGSSWDENMASKRGWQALLNINRDGVKVSLRAHENRFPPIVQKFEKDLAWSQVNLLTREGKYPNIEDVMAPEALSLREYLKEIKILDDKKLEGMWRLEEAGCFD